MTLKASSCLLLGFISIIGIVIIIILVSHIRDQADATDGKGMAVEAGKTGKAPTFVSDPALGNRGLSESIPSRRELSTTGNIPVKIPVLVVQVVDGEGKPQAGVPVAIQARKTLLLRARTAGELGLAHFSSLSLASVTADTVSIVFAFPHTGSTPVLLDPKSIPPEPVRLVLPPYGSVVLRLIDSEGMLIRLPLQMVLQGSKWVGGSRSQLVGYPDMIEAERGEAHFQFVGLGLNYLVHLMGSIAPSGRFKGPEKAGDVVRQDFVFQEQAFTVLLGRAIEPQKKPLAGIELRFSFESVGVEQPFQPGRGPQFFRLWADEFGRFSLPLGGGNRRPDESVFLRLTAELMTPAGPDLISGRLKLLFPLSQVEIDVGDICLYSVPLVAEGSVRSQSGNPISDAQITIQVNQDSPNEKSGSPVKGNKSDWRPLGQVRSDDSGRFRIQGFCSASSIGLLATKEGLLPNPRASVPVGTTDVQLVLGHPGGLDGIVLLEPDIPVDILNVRLLDLQTTIGGQTKPKPNGAFQMDSIRPGNYCLEISLHREREPFFGLSGLEVKQGETQHVGKIDLRGRIHSFQVLVEDDCNAPLPNVKAGLLREGPPGGGQSIREATYMGQPVQEMTYMGTTDKEGRVILFSSRPNMILTVHAWGRRARYSPAAPGLNHIILPLGIPVTLVLKEAIDYPAPPFYLYAQLLHPSYPFLEDSWIQGDQFGTDGRIDQKGTTCLLLPGPGRYRIHWMMMKLCPDAGTNAASRWSLGLKQPEIIVCELNEIQRFTVSMGVDSEEWRKIIEKFKKH